METLHELVATLSRPPWLYAALAALALVALRSTMRMVEHFAFVWRAPSDDDAGIRLVRGIRRLIFVACAAVFAVALTNRSEVLWITGAAILAEEIYETGAVLAVLRWERSAG